MAVKKEKLVHDTETARCRPIELQTENGFSIVRMCDLDRSNTRETDKYAFLVHDSHGQEGGITVEINVEIVEEITKRTRGRISSENSYWMSCAERHLADYLWENDQFPAGAGLTVDHLTPDDCDLAIRWDCNS